MACLCILIVSCVPRPVLQKPFAVLHFADCDLVIEGVMLKEEMLELGQGNLRFTRISQSPHFDVEGMGKFTIRGIRFHYVKSTLTCECEGFDKSLGAVIIRADGSLAPVNLLPLLAE